MPLPTTHTLGSKDKENRHSRKQERRSKDKNFGCPDCKQKEKSSHTGKIKKQKIR